MGRPQRPLPARDDKGRIRFPWPPGPARPTTNEESASHGPDGKSPRLDVTPVLGGCPGGTGSPQQTSVIPVLARMIGAPPSRPTYQPSLIAAARSMLTRWVALRSI